MSGELRAASPYDVECPSCEADPNHNCTEWSPTFQREFPSLDVHDERTAKAAGLYFCPECGEPDYLEKFSVDSVSGEAIIDRCTACGWSGDPQ